jgi:hypothetical protein
MSIQYLVDRGLEIIAARKKLDAELAEINEKLIALGYKAGECGGHEDLKDADREGKRWLAEGTAMIVPVIFTADMIVGSFAQNSDKHNAIALAAGPNFKQFFKPKFIYENRFDSGKKFRAMADEVFAKEAPAFVTACVARDKFGIPKSAVKIEWDKPEVKAA